ncbi:MAG TPA: hypothetical protein ENN69_07865, partial [Spirochaetia bacterium]|nr:hypothetical protein [Spirochaetia bacterium]
MNDRRQSFFHRLGSPALGALIFSGMLLLPLFLIQCMVVGEDVSARGANQAAERTVPGDGGAGRWDRKMYETVTLANFRENPLFQERID